MTSRAQLSFGVASRDDDDGGSALELVGLYEIPLFWAAGFGAEDLSVEPPVSSSRLRADPEEAVQTEANAELFRFESTVGRVHARLEPLARRAASSEDPWVRAVFAGMPLVVETLAGLPPDAPAVLDARAVAVVSPEGVIRDAIGRRLRALAELRDGWSDARARDVVCAMRPDVFRGVLSHDTLRARRVTDASSERAAFFTLGFGSAGGTAAARLQAWLAAAPPGASVRPLLEEAHLLADALASRGVIRLSDHGRAHALRYLALAARLRTPAALREIIDLLCTQGLVDGGAPPGERWTESVARRARSQESPVYDDAVLAAIVQMLDAGGHEAV